MQKLTPAMQQFYDAKEQHPDALIFFRMGDFYESFGDDAKTMAEELGITLTARGKSKEGEKMPLAGIPYHALDTYLPQLIKKGYKVAICEQLENPKKAKGVVKRGVVRVVTPGTAIDSSMFSDSGNNYLMVVANENGSGSDSGEFGISFLDVSTGEFLTTQFTDTSAFDKIVGEAARMRPSECILPPALYQVDALVARLKEQNMLVHQFDGEAFEYEAARRLLLKQFSTTTLEGMGCEALPLAIASAGATLAYANATQMRDLAYIQSIRTYFESEFMVLDSITLRNLEIVRNVRDGGTESSLLKILDHTKTAMGSRLLRKWLLQPLISVADINARLGAVEEIANNTLLRYDLRSHLSNIRDIERLIGRIVYGNANARDLVALKSSLGALPPIRDILSSGGIGSDLVMGLDFGDFTDIVDLIEQAIVDEPPLSIRDGRIIKSGFNEELDVFKDVSSGGKEWVANLQQKERERTGIKSLKIRYNKVFGYFIEVTKANLAQVPDDYIRKQTTANGERYYTPELKEREELILSADEKMVALEGEIFTQICSDIAARSGDIQAAAGAIGILDAIADIAEVSVNNGYVRPLISEGCEILIRDGRHPVVERSVPGGFVPNDTQLDCKDNQFHLITGPNMAGKSTFMRQSALIVVMAQVGCFVPATYASIGIVDRIFTRVGAFDDLASGQSTFMVEMVELANILNNATPRSLILLDEVGRGTSTFDGYSIARAVVEYIHNKGRAGVRGFFATHYHQLTELEGALKRVRNYHIAVKEDGHDLVFLRKIVPGATDKSYGIHVARLAGVPHKVIERAREVLKDVDSWSFSNDVEDGGGKGRRKRGGRGGNYTQVVLFGAEGGAVQAGVAELAAGSADNPNPVVEELRGLDVDAMTPRDALNALYELKKKVGDGE